MDNFRITRLLDLKLVWNFKFRYDKESKKIIWPFTRAWKATIKNCAGAICGAPPVTYDEWWNGETYLQKKAENDFEKWKK